MCTFIEMDDKEIIKFLNGPEIVMVGSVTEKCIIKTLLNSILNQDDFVDLLKKWEIDSMQRLLPILNEVCNDEISEEVCKDFFLKHIVSKMMSLEIEAHIRDHLIEIAFMLCSLIPVTDLTPEEYKIFLTEIYSNYIPAISQLRDSNYPNWHKLWIFLIKFCSKKIHESMDLTNRLLRIVEYAFRNSSFEQRLKGYDCWKELIDNASLDMNHMCTSKQIKLFVTPLRAKFSKQEVVICKRFDVFVHLLEKLQSQAVLCLPEFLEFCFGPEGDFKDSSRTGQVRSVPQIWPKCTRVLIGILGHSHEDTVKCVNVELNFSNKLVNEDNIKDLYRIIISSVAECCCRLKDDNMGSQRTKVIKCIWKSVFNLITGASESQKSKYFAAIGEVLDNFLIQSKENPFFEELCGLIFNTLKSFHVDILDGVIPIILRQLVTIFIMIDVPGNTITDNFKQAITQSFSKVLLEKNKIKMIQIVIDCLSDQFDKTNNKHIQNYSKIWIMLANQLISDFNPEKIVELSKFYEFFMWPSQNLHQLEETNKKQTALCWMKLYRKINIDDEYKKITIIKDLGKLFKENPLLSTNISSLLNIISQFETKISKNFVTNLMCVVSTVLQLPNLQAEDENKLTSLVMQYFEPSLDCYKSEELEELIKIISSCIEYIISIHSNIKIIEPFSTFFKNCPDKLKLFFSKYLKDIFSELHKREADSNKAKEIYRILLLFNNVTKAVEEEKRTFVIPTGRSARIANMGKNSPISPLKSTLRLFGKDPETMSPLKVKGSQLNNSPINKKKKGASIVDVKVIRPLNEENSSDFVPFDTQVQLQPEKLSEHQKEILKKRREDIPALYQDLSQSISQDIFTNSKEKSSSIELPSTKDTEKKAPSDDVFIDADKQCTESTLSEDLLLPSTENKEKKASSGDLFTNSDKQSRKSINVTLSKDLLPFTENKEKKASLGDLFTNSDKESRKSTDSLPITEDKEKKASSGDLFTNSDEQSRKTTDLLQINEDKEKKPSSGDLFTNSDKQSTKSTEISLSEDLLGFLKSQRRSRSSQRIEDQDAMEKKRRREIMKLKMDIVGAETFFDSPRRTRVKKVSNKGEEIKNKRDKIKHKDDKNDKKEIGTSADVENKKSSPLSKPVNTEKIVEKKQDVDNSSSKLVPESPTRITIRLKMKEIEPDAAKQFTVQTDVPPVTPKRTKTKSKAKKHTEPEENKNTPRDNKKTETVKKRRRSKSSEKKDSAQIKTSNITIQQLNKKEETNKTPEYTILSQKSWSADDKLGQRQRKIKRSRSRRRKSEEKSVTKIIETPKHKSRLTEEETQKKTIQTPKITLKIKREKSLEKPFNETPHKSKPEKVNKRTLKLKFHEDSTILEDTSSRKKHKELLQDFDKDSTILETQEDIKSKNNQKKNLQELNKHSTILEDTKHKKKLLQDLDNDSTILETQEDLRSEDSKKSSEKQFVEDSMVLEVTEKREENEDVIESSQESFVEILNSSKKRSIKVEEDSTALIQGYALELPDKIEVINEVWNNQDTTLTPDGSIKTDDTLDSFNLLSKPDISPEPPEKPQLTESELIMCQMDTISICTTKDTIDIEEKKNIEFNSVEDILGTPSTDTVPSSPNTPSTPRSQNLPSSPITVDTPIRTNELLDNTLNISPITSRTNSEEDIVIPVAEKIEVTINNNPIPDLKDLEKVQEDRKIDVEPMEKIQELIAKDQELLNDDSSDDFENVDASSEAETMSLEHSLEHLDQENPIQNGQVSTTINIVNNSGFKEPSMIQYRTNKLQNWIHSISNKPFAKRKSGTASSPSAIRIKKLFTNMSQKQPNQQVLENFSENDILTFSREIPSPLAVPRSSILKRKFSDSSDGEGISPCAKRKRVNFSDPCLTSKKVFIKDDYQPSFEAKRLFDNTPERKLTDDHLKDIFDYPDESPSSEFSSGTDSEIPETEPSLTVDNPMVLQKNKPIFPNLVECADDVLVIVKRITSPMFVPALMNKLKGKNVRTIGDLARLSESEVNRFPFKVPVVLNVLKALENYHRKKGGTYSKPDEKLENYTNEEKRNGEVEMPKLDVKLEMKMLVKRAHCEKVPIEDLAKILLPYVDRSKLSVLIKSQHPTMILEILEEKDYNNVLNIIIETKGISEILKSAHVIFHNAEKEHDFYQAIADYVKYTVPLEKFFRGRNIEDLEVGIEESIKNKVFQKNEIIENCLLPLIENPQDIFPYLNSLSTVHFGEIVLNRIRMEDPCKFFLRVIKFCTPIDTKIISESLWRQQASSPCEIVSCFEKTLDLLKEDDKTQTMVEMFKFINEKLDKKTLIDLHIIFLNRISGALENSD